MDTLRIKHYIIINNAYIPCYAVLNIQTEPVGRETRASQIVPITAIYHETIPGTCNVHVNPREIV